MDDRQCRQCQWRTMHEHITLDHSSYCTGIHYTVCPVDRLNFYDTGRLSCCEKSSWRAVPSSFRDVWMSVVPVTYQGPWHRSWRAFALEDPFLHTERCRRAVGRVNNRISHDSRVLPEILLQPWRRGWSNAIYRAQDCIFNTPGILS